MAERPWSGCLSGRTATRCSLRGRGSDDECVADAAAQPALHRRHQSQTTRGAGQQPTRPGQGRPHPGRRPPLHRPHPTAPARTRTSRRRVIRRRRQGSARGTRPPTPRPSAPIHRLVGITPQRPRFDTVRVAVRLAFSTTVCRLVPPGSLPEVPTCRSESRPGRPPPMVLCPLLGLPAGARVDPPGLVEECGHGLQLTSANYLTWVKVPAQKGQLPAVSPPCVLLGSDGEALRVR
jgi:hypothetical protein